jgi:membrane dipeptidase
LFTKLNIFLRSEGSILTRIDRFFLILFVELIKIMQRRQFIIQSSLLGAAVFTNSIEGNVRFDLNEVDRLVANTFGIDTHNHVDVPFLQGDFAGQQYDLTKDLTKSGLGTICLTFSVDRPMLKNSGEAYSRFRTSLQEIDDILLKNNVTRALHVTDIQRARKNKNRVIIQSVEGGHFLEGQIERLEEAYQLGLRHLGLLHDNDANPALGDIYTNAPQFGGLTGFGKEVIQACNQLGILIDLTHCNDKAIDDAINISKTPILVSHTGLSTLLGTNAAMAQMMKPRLISPEQAKKVANAGGVIGVWKHLTESAENYVRNIRQMVDLVGIDNVCLGTDSKLTTNSGPDSNTPRMGEMTNGIWKNQSKGFYYEAIENMIKLGFTEVEMQKIGSGNFLRVFDAATNV